MNPEAAVQEAKAMYGPGLYEDMQMQEYIEIDALGSSRIEHLGVSPLHYRHMLTAPERETDATNLGTAVHMAVLQPDLFKATYAAEPDLDLIGGAKPRATKVYKDAVDAMEADGLIVLKGDVLDKVIGMAASVLSHPHAAAVLRRCPEREVTAIWDRDGRLCRGRIDALGNGALADLKTTRKLKDFSPWTITRMGYYRQLAHEVDGCRAHGRDIEHVFLVAVENVAPYDVGVWTLDESTIQVGRDEIARLLDKLAECERLDRWPGQFPGMNQAMLSDAVALQLPDLEGDE